MLFQVEIQVVAFAVLHDSAKPIEWKKGYSPDLTETNFKVLAMCEQEFIKYTNVSVSSEK